MNSSPIQPDLLKTRQHFEILDGLRGIAAISVVIFHFMEIIIPQFSDNLIAHAYLAVDFFFCLSGFVIAYAYDKRIRILGTWEFFKLRLIRLHPLVVIGSVIGLVAFILDPFSDLYKVYGFGKTMIMFITSCFMIPYPIVSERFYNLFHLNAPAWSLFYEYIANIFYAVIFFRLRKKILWLLVVVAAGLLFFEANRSGHLVVGWGYETFWGGPIRVFFSFLAGMLVYRSNWIIRSSIGFPVIALLLIMGFLFPFIDGYAQFTDPLLVAIYFPIIIALGAGGKLNPVYKKLCRFLGDISYPLYMVHYPFIWIFLSYVEKEKPGMQQYMIIVPIAVILLIAFAYLVMITLDAPIRSYLTGKMKRKMEERKVFSGS